GGSGGGGGGSGAWRGGMDLRGQCGGQAAIWCGPSTGQTYRWDCQADGMQCLNDSCAVGAYCCGGGSGGTGGRGGTGGTGGTGGRGGSGGSRGPGGAGGARQRRPRLGLPGP